MAMSAIVAPSKAVPISINGRNWDPKINYARDAARTNYITITTLGPILAEHHEKLRALGVEIQEQVDLDTYLCHYERSDLQPIRDEPFVRQADVFRSKFKIVSDLKKATIAAEGNAPKDEPVNSFNRTAQDGPFDDSAAQYYSRSTILDPQRPPTYGLMAQETVQMNIPVSETVQTNFCTVDIVLHHKLEAKCVITELAEEAKVSEDSIEFSTRKLRMTVDRCCLKALATHDCVRAIEEVWPKVVHNNYARDIMCAAIEINDTQFHGAGQIVAVADTGFDAGSVTGCHPAFKDRVSALIPIARKATGNDTPNVNDPTGHGTHVCGSIVGQNLTSTVFPESPISGIAPEANLIVQSLFYGRNEEIKPPLDLSDHLFDPPYYDFNARIHTNSWGERWEAKLGQRAYTCNDAEEVDEFVWRTKTAVVLFSAGNDNLSAAAKASIGAQAAAKNCITVGATGSGRKGNGPGISPEQMYEKSSIGPTREGRIKPDVVAPGTNILSTNSQDGGLQTQLAQADKKLGRIRDPLFEIRNGTSMSTPLVAGCVAVIREVFEKNGVKEPSAALVKAVVINGAVPLPGVSKDAQGFGRVNLKNSVDMIFAKSNVGAPEAHTGHLIGQPLKQDKRTEVLIRIPPHSANGNEVQFKITLAYSDRPGHMLQNNLNLIVIAAGGSEKHGNGYENEQYDDLNNVEQIAWTGMPPGDAKVVIWASRITKPDDEQAFGLAWKTEA